MERFWRQQAKPPTPTPGSLRAEIPRNVAIARAYREWSDLDKVIAIYRACAVLNELGWGVFEVAHYVPLQSARVSGLHTHDNLYVTTREENRAAGTWAWPDMWPVEWEDFLAMCDFTM